MTVNTPLTSWCIEKTKIVTLVVCLYFLSLGPAAAWLLDFLSNSVSVSGETYSENGVTVSHIHTFKHPCHLFTLNWSPNGRYLTGGGVGCVEERVWDFETKSLAMSTKKQFDGRGGIGFAPDSRYVISSSATLPKGKKKLANTVWDVQTGQPIKDLMGLHNVPQANMSKFIQPDPNGEYVFVDGAGYPGVKVLDAHTFEYLYGLETIGERTDVNSLTVHPKGQFLAFGTGGSSGFVQVWNYKSSELALQFRAQTGTVKSIAFSPDGRYLATGGSNGHSVALYPGGPLVELHDDDLVRVWDTDTYEMAWSYVLDGATRIDGMSYSPDGRFLVVTTWRDMFVLDAHSNRILLTFRTPLFKRGLAFQPHNNIFAVIGDDLITIWKIETH